MAVHVSLRSSRLCGGLARIGRRDEHSGKQRGNMGYRQVILVACGDGSHLNPLGPEIIDWHLLTLDVR